MSSNSIPALAATPAPQSPTNPTNQATAQTQIINPLTGLPVEDPSLLDLPPALVSISNFPVSARPQAGLSTSPIVFEMYIGYGMTRFLALFYGDYAVGQKTAAQQAAEDAAIGPIRSGRLVYEDVRTLYDGFIVMAGAYSKVAEQLHSATTVYGSDPNNINSAGVTLAKLQDLASANMDAAGATQSSLQGLQFASGIPADGQRGDRLWMFYNYYNQVEWTYDSASGAYLRAQDKSDASGLFYPALDRQTGQQLAFNNVVVLFAKHDFIAPSLIDIEMLYVKDNPALLFRDGKVYEAKWSSQSPVGPIRLTGANGEIIPYKPGNTWFEIVDRYTAVTQPEEGQYRVRFSAPK
jgi:hypothetical protein